MNTGDAQPPGEASSPPHSLLSLGPAAFNRRARAASLDSAATPSKRASDTYGGQEDLSILLLSGGRLKVIEAADGAGRGVAATVPFRAGDTLLVERAFACSPGPYSSGALCHACCSPETDDGPPLSCCPCCGWAHFCCADCADASAEAAHTPAECAAMRACGYDALSLPPEVVLAARLLRWGGGGDDDDGDALRSAQRRLATDLCGWSPDLPAATLRRFAELAPTVLALSGAGGGAPVGGAAAAADSAALADAVTLLCQCHRNAFRWLDFREPAVEVGSALFPAAARVNHSCDPNAAAANDGAWTLRITALRRVEPGEEVRIAYVTGSAAARSDALRNKYCFSCGCGAPDCCAGAAPE